jgi:hypothetical protein
MAPPDSAFQVVRIDLQSMFLRQFPTIVVLANVCDYHAPELPVLYGRSGCWSSFMLTHHGRPCYICFVESIDSELVLAVVRFTLTIAK